MILLYHVVNVLALTDLNVSVHLGVDRFRSSLICTTLVDVYLFRRPAGTYGLLEEALGCLCVTMCRQKVVNSVSFLVYTPI